MGASALIVAKAGPIRDGLHALVTAMPQIDAVQEANDVASALEVAFERPPSLVVLESTPGGKDVWMAVRRVKTQWPTARCILLVSDVEQRREAEAAGADVVLLEGFPAGRLVTAIVRLLPQPVTKKHKGQQGHEFDDERAPSDDMTTTVMQEVWNAWTECETASDVVVELQTMDGRRKISNTVCK